MAAILETKDATAGILLFPRRVVGPQSTVGVCLQFGIIRAGFLASYEGAMSRKQDAC